MKKLSYLINLIIILAITMAVIIYLGGYLSWFLDYTSVLFLLILTLSSILMNYGLKDFARFHKSAFSDLPEDQDYMKKAVNCFSMIRMNLMAAGVIGAALGLIVMLGNLNDTSHIGPALATTLMTVFYAFLLQLIWVNPLLTRLKSKLD